MNIMQKSSKNIMDRTKDIIKSIDKMSGSNSPYQVFCDWVKCFALSISNNFLYNENREQEFIKTIDRYDGNEFAKISAMLTETIEAKHADVLGNLFMEAGYGNKNTGQFFTPYPVSYACASIQKFDDKIIEMNEPSAGAGGMVIATSEAMLNQGINPQKKLRVIAQDLDWNALYMCYVQLSLYGIDAKVVQGDTLMNEKHGLLSDKVFLTPMYFLNGALW